ncbi:MAG: peptide ABC transporter substrate-binding protein [Robiginitomaculum sp.]|nr:peptide ABC transporter substrate-binding protein [Robiginitomaculum sp.]
MAFKLSLSRRGFLLASVATGLVSCGGSGNGSATLRIGIATAPDSLDPAQGQFAAAALLFKQLYTPLTNYGADGGLAPGLAQSWHMSDDGLHWTFVLRSGLRWSDGQPITANDVVGSVRRMLDPTSLYTDVGDFDLLVNAMDVLTGVLPIEQLGVTALNDTTVRFSFTAPLGVFGELMREFYPTPEHIVPNAQSKWPLPPDFVGSGPYVVEKASLYEFVLRKNRHAPDPPLIDNIYLSVVEDAATRARMIRAGDLDLAEDPPANQIVSLQTREESRLYSWKSPKLVYLKVNHKHPALANIAVRKALNLAVDREFISEKLFADFSDPAYGILPWATSPLLESFEERIITAKALMTQAGYADGLTLTLLHSGELRERIAVELAQNWKKIGVTCHIQGTDGQGLYSFIEAGEFDLAMASFDRGLKRENWRMIEPFASTGFAANFNWTSDQYDQLVADARTRANPVERDWLAAEAADLIANEAAIVPLIFEKKFWLANNKLSGFSSEIPPDQWRLLSGI